MKKIFAFVVVLSFLNGCASYPSYKSYHKYTLSEFSTNNYQKIIGQTFNLYQNFASKDNFPQTDLDPTDFALLLQADIDFNQSNYVNSALAYTALAKKYKTAQLALKAIIAINYANDYSSSKIFNDLVAIMQKQAPNTDVTKLLLMRQYITNNDTTKVKKYLRDLIDTNPQCTRELLLFVGTSTTSLQKLNQSLADEILDNYQDYPEAHLTAGLIYAQNSNLVLLDRQVKFMLQNYPNWEVPYFMISLYFAKNNQWSNLANLMQNVIYGSDNLSPIMQNIYVLTMIKTDKQSVALDYLNQLIIKTKSNQGDTIGNANLNMAIIYIKSGNYDLGLNYLKLAQNDGYTLNGATLLMIGAIYDYQKKYRQAIDTYKNINTQNNVLYELSQLAIIKSYIDLGNYSIANSRIEQFAKATNLGLKKSLLLKASFYIEANKLKDAYNVLHKYYSKYSNDVEYMYQYATVLSMLNKTKDALRIYEKCIKLSPNNPSILNDYAYILATQTNQLSEARVMAYKSLQLNATNYATLDTVAWIYYLEKDYQKALNYAKQAYAISPDNEVSKHLRAIYIALGDTKMANQVLIVSDADQKTDHDKFILDKALTLMMYLQYGVEIK